MVMRVPNEGMPKKSLPDKGDLFVQFVVTFPKSYFAPNNVIKVCFDTVYIINHILFKLVRMGYFNKFFVFWQL